MIRWTLVIRFFFFLALLSACTGRLGGDNTSDLQSEGQGPEISGTLLLSSSLSNPPKLGLIRLDDQIQVTEIDATLESRIAWMASSANAFYVLEEKGALSAFDKQGQIIYRVQASKSPVHSFEIVSPTLAYISHRDSASLVKVDIRQGKVLRTLDLGAAISDQKGAIGARHAKLVGNRLFVLISADPWGPQPGTRLATLEDDQVLSVVELTVEDRGVEKPIIGADLPMLINPVNGQIVVNASGRRPTDTGFTLFLDSGGSIVGSFKPSAFNGHRIYSGLNRTMFSFEHTSTPVASTHVMASKIDDAGQTSPISHKSTLDLFESTDFADMNEGETLIVIANSCPVGFCTTGKGLNFIDPAKAKVLPKLTAGTLGMTPDRAVFLRSR